MHPDPSFLDTCLAQFVLSDFEVNWRQHAVVRVLSARVVEHLDVVEHVLPCGITGWVYPPPDPFPFQELEEAFCHSVIRCPAVVRSQTMRGGKFPRLLMLASRLCLPRNDCHSLLVNCDP